MPQSFLNRYQRDAHGVFVPRGKADFPYSDGDAAEARVASLIRRASDRSVLSPEMLHGCTDWVTRYHLSPLRANLLRPASAVIAGKTVLELGAGCGALTRFLGETARRVVALEGSLNRARIAAARCRDMENVTIFSETIQDVALSQRFDVVTLIGVLEYARVYDKTSACPELRILETARGFLKPDGHLLLAIENQLGVKYFAGACEDHVGQAFFGIHDRYDRNSVVTFGRLELEKLLFAAGFSAVSQFIPLPDYKLPVTVLHPASLDGSEPNVALAPLVLNSLSYDHQKTSKHCFSLEASCNALLRNGLLKDLCNSLYLMASNSKQDSALDPAVLASHYGGRRYREFAKETLFVRRNGGIRVARRYLDANSAHAANGVRCVLRDEEEDYRVQKVFHETLVPVINTPNWTVAHIAKWAEPWLAYLQELSVPCEGDDTVRTLPGSCVDMVPFNFFIDSENRVTPFDIEWEPAESHVSLQYVALRGLYNSLACFSNVARPAPGTPLNVITLAAQALELSGIRVGGKDVVRFMAHYCLFSENATGSSSTIESMHQNKLTVRTLA